MSLTHKELVAGMDALKRWNLQHALEQAMSKSQFLIVTKVLGPNEAIFQGFEEYYQAEDFADDNLLPADIIDYYSASDRRYYIGLRDEHFYKYPFLAPLAYQAFLTKRTIKNPCVKP